MLALGEGRNEGLSCLEVMGRKLAKRPWSLWKEHRSPLSPRQMEHHEDFEQRNNLASFAQRRIPRLAGL